MKKTAWCDTFVVYCNLKENKKKIIKNLNKDHFYAHHRHCCTEMFLLVAKKL